nr:ribonuclease H-like domain-containing protein [Tanacetum cinerariifolium]
MTSFGYRSNPFYAIKECSSCGTLYTRDCGCSKGNVEDKILVPKPLKNYARCTRCGYLVDGPNCQGCALLRQELEKNLESHSPDFQNTFELSNASTNVVNAPREPYVVKQDNGSFVDKIIFDLNRAPDSPNQFHCFHCKDVLRDEKPVNDVLAQNVEVVLEKRLCYICGHNQNSLNDSPSISETSSQSPPNINHCCNECGDPLDGIFCKRCTCMSCGKDAHIVYNCPSKVSVISNPEPCNNKTIDELPQTLPIFHPTFHFEAESPVTLDSTPIYVDESPNVFNSPPQSFVYLCEFCWNDAYHGHYCTPQAPFLYPEPYQIEDFSESSKEFSSIDDDSFSIDHIDYVEASPLDSELVSSEISSGSTTTPPDISLPKYEFFYDDHVKEIISGSPTTLSDSFLYASFIFDLSINPFPPVDRSIFMSSPMNSFPSYLHQNISHEVCFDIEYPETPNDDERVDPSLNSNQKPQSDSSHSSVPGGDVHIADFPSNNSRNDADSSYDIFATQNEQVTTLKENIFSEGKLKYFLGIKVIDTVKGICLDQTKYVLDLLSEYGMLACKPAKTPLMYKLSILNEATNSDPTIDNITDYQKLMGKLIYLTNTRPDISYVVHCLSQFMHSPLKCHLKIAFKILRYLKSCLALGIHVIKNS